MYGLDGAMPEAKGPREYARGPFFGAVVVDGGSGCDESGGIDDYGGVVHPLWVDDGVVR